MNQYDVYIMASRSGVLYVGITSDLVSRVRQHKLKLLGGFTAKYNVNRLVWHESFSDVNEAIACEKRIKGWRRSKKVALIEESNPGWIDLGEEFATQSDEASAPPCHPERTREGSPVANDSPAIEIPRGYTRDDSEGVNDSEVCTSLPTRDPS